MLAGVSRLGGGKQGRVAGHGVDLGHQTGDLLVERNDQPEGRKIRLQVTLLALQRDYQRQPHREPGDEHAGQAPIQAWQQGSRVVQWLPEWPKPPAPRWVSSKVSTMSKCACTTGTSTSCAMRSPMAMVKGVWPRFQHDTISSPW